MKAAWVLVTVLLLACGRTPQPDEPTPVATPSVAEPTTAEPTTEPASPAEPDPQPSQREPNLTLVLDQEVNTTKYESIVLSSFVVETIEPDPEDPEGSPGGGGLVLQVEVDGEALTFSDLPAAYGSKKVAWLRGLRLELVDYDTRDNSARFYLDRRTDNPKYRRKVTVAKGESIELDDGWSMKFESHGHKSVMRGQRSPLLVYVRFSKGGSSDDQRYGLYTTAPEKRTWTWRDYRFDLEDHQYDQSMELVVQRMEIEPVSLEADDQD